MEHLLGGHLRRAIRKAPAEYGFPWQMKLLIGLARMLPPFIYDRVLKNQTASKEIEPSEGSRAGG